MLGTGWAGVLEASLTTYGVQSKDSLNPGRASWAQQPPCGPPPWQRRSRAHAPRSPRSCTASSLISGDSKVSLGQAHQEDQTGPGRGEASSTSQWEDDPRAPEPLCPPTAPLPLHQGQSASSRSCFFLNKGQEGRCCRRGTVGPPMGPREACLFLLRSGAEAPDPLARAAASQAALSRGLPPGMFSRPLNTNTSLQCEKWAPAGRLWGAEGRPEGSCGSP